MKIGYEQLPSPEQKDKWVGATYQIYPRTFHEARGENEPHQGVGSLRGITEKCDYLKDLGVKGIWISPFYPSPLIDGGYDISDYTDVDPSLGTLDDFDRLVKAYHEHNMTVMIDLVPNHTSSAHPWFQESRSSADNPKSDWYTWHDGNPDGTPPNNWTSVFSIPQLRARERGELIVPDGENTPGVSAWTFDEQRGQYYLRDFDASQPNLNWQNPEVREAIKEVQRFWLRRGVDGFRVDVANHLAKNPDFTDELPNPDYNEGVDNPHDQHIFHHSINYPPKLHEYIGELVSVLDEPEFRYRDTRMILECWMPPEDQEEINRRFAPRAASFNFTPINAPWQAPLRKSFLDSYHANLPPYATPNHVLSNHDVTPVVSKIGREAARAAAVLTLTLPGGPFIYNGEEYGREEVNVPLDRRRDTELGERDGSRTPMLWDDTENAGFSRASPNDLWLPIDPDYQAKNIAVQSQDPRSHYNLYKTLLHFSNTHPVMQEGAYVPLDTDDQEVLAFARRRGHDQMITIVNFSSEARQPRILMQQVQQILGSVVISSTTPHPRTTVLDREVNLSPNEAIVVTQAA